MQKSFFAPYRRPRGYRVNPLSIESIRDCALLCRQALGLGDDKIDGTKLIDILSAHDITVDIVEDDQVKPSEEALCIPDERLILLPEKTFASLAAGNPRALFTLAHELGHLFLHQRVVLARGDQTHAIFEDSEWQADCFAAEFLMPLDAIKQRNLKSAPALMRTFGVSQQAAENRLSSLRQRNAI